MNRSTSVRTNGRPRLNSPSIFIFVTAALIASCGVIGSENASGGQNHFTELLASIPDTAETRSEITLTNWAQAKESVEIDEFSGDLAQFLFDATARIEDDDGKAYPQVASSWLPALNVATPALWRSTYGWEPRDIAYAIRVGTLPDVVVGVATHRDAQAIQSDLEASTEWPQGLDYVEYGKDGYFRSGDDYSLNLETTSALRPLGRSGRLLIVSSGDGPLALGSVFLAPADALITGVADTIAGDARSLDDNLDLHELALLMGDEKMTTVWVSAGALLGNPPTTSTQGAPQTPTFFALGHAIVLGQRRAIWAASYETPEAATTAANWTNTHLATGTDDGGVPWSERVTVLKTETVGNLAVIHVEPSWNLMVLYDAALRRDGLFTTKDAKPANDG